jgi:hypothetical protein
MYTPKFPTKRALGLALAAALAVSGTVALASNSEASTVPPAKVSPVTGATGGGTIVTITGKGFQSAAGTNQVGQIWFSTTSCSPVASGAGSIPVVILSVVSETKIVITTPALPLASSPAPTTFNLCVQDLTLTTSGNILGAATYTSYVAPLINTALGGTNGMTTASGASVGGDAITITGENFTAKTVASIGGVALVKAKVVVGNGTSQTANQGDDTISGLVPVGTVGTQAVLITTQGGSATAGGAGVKAFTYLDGIKVSPTFGDGVAARVITLRGVGFSARSYAATTPAINKATIQVVKATTNTATGVAVATYVTAVGTNYCTKVQVESDTSLTCQMPALVGAANAGPYTVQIVDVDGTVTSAVTAVSRGATYTVSAF